MAKDVILFGTGDFARVASVYLEKDSPHKVIGFSVHEGYRTEPPLLGKPIVPFESPVRHFPPAQDDPFVAMGIRKMTKARGFAEWKAAMDARGFGLNSMSAADLGKFAAKSNQDLGTVMKAIGIAK